MREKKAARVAFFFWGGGRVATRTLPLADKIEKIHRIKQKNKRETRNTNRPLTCTPEYILGYDGRHPPIHSLADQ